MNEILIAIVSSIVLLAIALNLILFDDSESSLKYGLIFVLISLTPFSIFLLIYIIYKIINEKIQNLKKNG